MLIVPYLVDTILLLYNINEFLVHDSNRCKTLALVTSILMRNQMGIYMKNNKKLSNLTKKSFGDFRQNSMIKNNKSTQLTLKSQQYIVLTKYPICRQSDLESVWMFCGGQTRLFSQTFVNVLTCNSLEYHTCLYKLRISEKTVI